jgi:2-polyprenyl-3-methyl-5-hydroxy-6-metoxy-1,4-benzoquinol methylase
VLLHLIRRVEYLRARALTLLSSAATPETVSETQILPGLLASFELCASVVEEQRWCARYVSCDRDAALRELEAGDDRDGDEAIKLVRAGYVELALAQLDSQTYPSGEWSVDARRLRLLVGVLLLRSGDLVRIRGILDRFSDEDLVKEELERVRAELTERVKMAAPPERVDERRSSLRELVWWWRMLRARVLHQEGLDISGEIVTLNVEGMSTRQGAWHLALDVLTQLRHGAAVNNHLLVQTRLFLKSAISTPESLFALLQLARGHAAQGDIVDALRWLHTGITEAAVRNFPVEYALFMMFAAVFVRRAAKDHAFRDRCVADGVNHLSLLEGAERLAVHSADIFTRLNLHAHRDFALVAAAKCAMARKSFPSLAAAAMWAELAKNNAVLSKHRLSEDLLDKIQHSWTREPSDPGTANSRFYYDRYGWAIGKLWGTASSAIELVKEAHGTELVDAGGALRTLFERAPLDRDPLRILVVGCGAGSEAFRLAERFPEARIVGVDVSSWQVEAATKKAVLRNLGSRCTFRRADLLDGDEVETDARWDLVLMRDMLQHVTYKRSFLTRLRKLVAPGAVLRMTDLCQRRLCGPLEWRKVLHSVWLTNLSTVDGIGDELKAAGFRLTHGPFDESARAHAFLASRLRWFREHASTEAPDLCQIPLITPRVELMLGTLVEASADAGPLGWVYLGAQVV